MTSPNASVSSPSAVSSVSSPSSSSASVVSSVTPPVSSVKPVGSVTVKPLGWWEDYLAWWAEQTERAKNLQDKEAEQIRENAAVTGDPDRIAAANAYIGNLDAIAKLNGCTSISSCNTAEMNDLREVWRNTQGLPPAEQLNLQNRIAFNIYEFAISPNRCNNCRNAVTAVLDNLSRSTKIGRKNGYKTADQMWGDSKGLNLTDAQNNAMKGVQKSILNGSMTAAKWKDRLQGNDLQRLLGGIEGGWELFAQFALMGFSNEQWLQVADALLRGGLIVLLTAGLGSAILPLMGLLMGTGMSATAVGLISGIGVLFQQFGLAYTVGITVQGIGNLFCGKSFVANFNGNSKSASITAFGASFLGTVPAAFVGINKLSSSRQIMTAILNVARTSPYAAVPTGVAAGVSIGEAASEGCG